MVPASRGGITRCEPPRLLSHTWVEAWGGAYEVTYELSPRGDEVLLVLTHRRLPTSSLVSVASGWHTHLGVLLDHLIGRDRQPFWSTHTRLADEYRQRLATT